MSPNTSVHHPGFPADPGHRRGHPRAGPFPVLQALRGLRQDLLHRHRAQAAQEALGRDRVHHQRHSLWRLREDGGRGHDGGKSRTPEPGRGRKYPLGTEEGNKEAAGIDADIPPERLFFNRPAHERLLVFIAGPLFNLVLALPGVHRADPVPGFDFRPGHGNRSGADRLGGRRGGSPSG